MKKTLIFLPLFVLIVLAGTAQGFHLGAKLGANMDKIAGKSFSDEFKLGYHLGGFVEIDFSKTLGIQPELLFSQTNTKVTDDLDELLEPGDEINLNYLNIPILLRINASKLLTLHVGPQFSILMNKDDNLLENGEAAFKSGDFAMVAGAQLNLGSLRVYGRYNIGLSDISDIDNQDSWKSQQIQFGLGLRIF